MAETPDDLKRDIESARARISGDVHELEYRLRRATSLRAQFLMHRRAILAAAFGAGLALALISGRRH
jgi:hypothetical protein